MSTPGFWMHETSGVLRPAVEAYLQNHPLHAEHIASLRAYLRQWIAAPEWTGEGVDDLRSRIDKLISRTAISRWLADALELGIDPL